MNSQKQLILATKPFAKEIKWKSWLYTLSTLSILVASLYGTYACPLLWERILCSIFSGLVMVRFFVIYHDYQHHAILHQSLPAKIIFSLFGIFILAPTSIWKRSHDYHHNHNSKLASADIGSFPIMTVRKYRQVSRSERTIYLAIRHPLTIMFGYISMFIYGMCIQSFSKNPSKHKDSLLSLLIHFSVSVWIGLHFGILTWFLSCFIPFFIADMIGSYLFYAQHNFPGVHFKNNKEWTYLDAAMQSSSYMTMNIFWRWVTGNIGYHHIHHINSRIPFYRLPEVMKAIPEFRKVSSTTLNFRDIAACLRLKVWDEV